MRSAEVHLVLETRQHLLCGFFRWCDVLQRPTSSSFSTLRIKCFAQVGLLLIREQCLHLLDRCPILSRSNILHILFFMRAQPTLVLAIRHLHRQARSLDGSVAIQSNYRHLFGVGIILWVWHVVVSLWVTWVSLNYFVSSFDKRLLLVWVIYWQLQVVDRWGARSKKRNYLWSTSCASYLWCLSSRKGAWLTTLMRRPLRNYRRLKHASRLNLKGRLRHLIHRRLALLSIRRREGCTGRLVTPLNPSILCIRQKHFRDSYISLIIVV